MSLELKNIEMKVGVETYIHQTNLKIEKNTRVQYSNPFIEPCEYMAICLPAFAVDLVHREEA